MDWTKDIITTIWILLLSIVGALFIAGIKYGVIGMAIGLVFDWLKQWAPMFMLLGIPILMWFVLFGIFVVAVWITVRVVRNAWRG